MKGVCAYCGVRRAVNLDHVVPKALRKKYGCPEFLAALSPACFECNHRKGQRRLVPPSWAQWITALCEAYPGTPWRVWSGGLDEEAYREAHV